MKWITRFVFLSLICASCTRSNTEPTPAVPGRIELSVSPTTVSYAGGAGVGGAVCTARFPSRWGPFVWTIKETNGTAVTIASFKYETFTTSGASLSIQELASSMALEFTGTAAPNLKLPASSSLSSRAEYDCEPETNGLPSFPGGSVVFTATGTDVNGSAVSSSATLILSPPQ